MTGQAHNNEDDNSVVKRLKLIAQVVGIIGTVVTIVATTIIIYKNITERKPPIVTVENRLRLPIIVTINDTFTRRIPAGEKQTISLLSENEFPAKVKWRVERYRNNLGQLLGEEMSEETRFVDKGADLVADNEIGITTYFYPIIVNNTDMKCTIIVNDGLTIEYLVGVSSPHTTTNLTGYYKYATNTNVTLECAGNVYWRGKRNGVPGPEIKVDVGSGVIKILIP